MIAVVFMEVLPWLLAVFFGTIVFAPILKKLLEKLLS
jgi:hypothetical protein